LLLAAGEQQLAYADDLARKQFSNTLPVVEYFALIYMAGTTADV
jgi:hypothetical protein